MQEIHITKLLIVGPFSDKQISVHATVFAAARGEKECEFVAMGHNPSTRQYVLHHVRFDGAAPLELF